jgi:hypothetical protein
VNQKRQTSTKVRTLQQIEHYVHSLLQSMPEDDVDKEFVSLASFLRAGKY